MEKEIALFKDFVMGYRCLGPTSSTHRRPVVVAAAAGGRLNRTTAPQARAAAITLQLRVLLEFLFTATVASHSSVPVEFLGFNAPLFDSDLLGRRRLVEITGRLGVVTKGSFRLGRLAERALNGGYSRSSSKGGSSREVNTALRVSHLEASLSIYSLPPTAADAAFFPRRSDRR